MAVTTVDPPDFVLRVARVDSSLRFSRITPADSRSDKAGNRYDVVGGGVLYGADELQTCYRETLARFRPSPRIYELLREPDPEEPHFMVCGGVPQDWRLNRRIYRLALENALPFVDVESPETLAILEAELAPALVRLGYTKNLDLSDLRNRDRRLSRAMAEWAYTAQNEAGDALYSGIRYCSRVDESKVCWAVFEGTTIFEASYRAIELTDEVLQEVARIWRLRIF
jgi:RES domain